MTVNRLGFMFSFTLYFSTFWSVKLLTRTRYLNSALDWLVAAGRLGAFVLSAHLTCACARSTRSSQVGVSIREACASIACLWTTWYAIVSHILYFWCILATTKFILVCSADSVLCLFVGVRSGTSGQSTRGSTGCQCV